MRRSERSATSTFAALKEHALGHLHVFGAIGFRVHVGGVGRQVRIEEDKHALAPAQHGAAVGHDHLAGARVISHRCR
eukprot:scaffold27063_cov64-Phaeocystis_antarctica.AAC.9